MKHTILTILSLVSIGLGLAYGVAQAQIYSGGDADILIDADKALYRGGLTVLEGNVDVRQGDAQIFSDTMHIYRTEVKNPAEVGLNLGAVTRIVAEGNFRYITPKNQVTGNKGVYNRETGVIVITGNVVFIEGSGTRVKGNSLTYDVAKRSAKFGDRCVGSNCTNRVTFGVQQD